MVRVIVALIVVQLTVVHKMCPLGAHISISGGFHKVFESASQIGCEVIQIFTTNQVRWNFSSLNKEEIFEFVEANSKFNISVSSSHAPYLLNLCTDDNSLYKKSILSLKSEIIRSKLLGIKNIVIHPGSHRGKGIVNGINRIVIAIKELIEQCKNRGVKILIETTSGAGTQVGWRFEHLRDIIDGVSQTKIIGVCLDTCHIFSAGYPIHTKEGYEKTIEALDKTVGIEMVKIIHLNDSKYEFSSKKDRHQHIGKGYIGIEPFRWILNDERWKNLPMIIETPYDMEMDKENIAILKRLRN